MHVKDLNPERFRRRPPVDAEIVDGESAEVSNIEVVLGGGGTAGYTSDDMEADFSTSVELLMGAVGYLQMIEELDAKHNFFTIQSLHIFKDHLEKVEEFVGQWDS